MITLGLSAGVHSWLAPRRKIETPVYRVLVHRQFLEKWNW